MPELVTLPVRVSRRRRPARDDGARGPSPPPPCPQQAPARFIAANPNQQSRCAAPINRAWARVSVPK
ncbi:hypothetical protein BZL30_9482 [Mycobacterium kansasii]|uniref:Uncharacterized protein n=1 Tax=Mycobacterium kansasii TaxID=1768 RepID=A0A1V3W8V7_MYCKA|nr:hypothetical protein BZL30_9482 [Mycobacterium kansasii]